LIYEEISVIIVADEMKKINSQTQGNSRKRWFPWNTGGEHKPNQCRNKKSKQKSSQKRRT